MSTNKSQLLTSMPEQPTAKRRRISLACSACRARKSRCDGVRPKCSGCTDLGFDCTYVSLVSSANVIVGKDYLSTLENRLQVVEEYISCLKGSHGSHGSRQRQLRFDDDPRSAGLGDTDLPSPSIESPVNEELEVDSDSLQDSSGLGNDTDGMGAMVFSTEQDCGFFGPSSNISFTRHTSRAMAHLSNNGQSVFAAMVSSSPGILLDSTVISVSQPPSPSGKSKDSRSISASSHRKPVNIYALPAETTARDLLRQYFSDTGMLFPYIHEQTFLENYDKMKSNNFRKVRRTWLGLMNMIMAFAISTRVEAGLSAVDRARESDVYCSRAAGLCENQILRGTSIEIVQYLLLRSQYLQGTQRSSETWTIHGLAVKAALQLGLHSSTASGPFSALEREIRKRTWFGCVVLDRTLSMTFGRPAAIPDDYVRIQLPQHLDLGASETHEDSESNKRQSASIDAFNGTITLYKLMWNVIASFYGGNIGFDAPSTAFETMSRLFTIEQQLIEWERLLPPTLALRKIEELAEISKISDTTTFYVERFRIILTLRYHNLCVLMHRPILVKFLDVIGRDLLNAEVQEVNLMQQIGHNSIHKCVQASMNIITIVRTIVVSDGYQRNLLGAWWFSLYYVFNAALVIFAALLVETDRKVNGTQPLSLPVPSHQLYKCLSDAAQVLRLLDCKNKMVDTCALYLEQLTGYLGTLGNQSFPVPESTNLAFDNTTGTVLSSYRPDVLLPPSRELMSHVSPVGMDFGEFVLDGDINFMNQLAGAGFAYGLGIPTSLELGNVMNHLDNR